MAFEPSRNLHTVAINLPEIYMRIVLWQIAINLPEIYIRMAILWQIAISVMAIAITVMAIAITVMAICHTIRTEICHKIVIVAINLLEIYIRIGPLPYGL